MKCKDINERPILELLAKLNGEWAFNWPYKNDGTSSFDWNRSVFSVMPDGIDYNLGHAKMRQMIAKELIDGCPCGCRGDYEITEKGRKVLGG